jgi:hypothetical protein
MKIIKIGQTRNDLASLFSGIGAEIGVEQGVFSEIICQNKKVTKLYAIDAWRVYKGYRDHTRQSKLDRFYEAAKKRLRPYNCEIVRKFSTEAVADFVAGALDFVYIDANHDYDHVYQDLELWSKKIKKGGLIAGHDYTRRKGQDRYYAVVPAVNDFAKTSGVAELTIYRGDSPASWMFRRR